MLEPCTLKRRTASTAVLALQGNSGAQRSLATRTREGPRVTCIHFQARCR
jgi:hypothetical protein